jgi:hypothetical protein
MPNKNGGEAPAEDEALTEIQSATRGAFRHVYGFILQAVKGDKATADVIFEDYLVIFEDYLAGKLSEELLSISQRCVSADQAIAGNRDIEEEWHRDKLRAGKGAGVSAGVSEDGPTTALS